MAFVVAVALLLLASAGAGCGGDDDGEQEPVQTTVDAIVDVPPRFLREPVRVAGRAMPLDDEWFVLRGRRDAVLVAPEPGAVEGRLQRGDEVTVLGVVETFNRLQLSELERLGASGELAGAPAERGDPYVSADSVAG